MLTPQAFGAMVSKAISDYVGFADSAGKRLNGLLIFSRAGNI